MLAASCCFRRHLSHAITKRNLAATRIHPHWSGFIEKIETIAAPSPLLGRLHKSAFHRIPMHVSELFHSLPGGPDVEVVEACLPECSRLNFVSKEIALQRIPSPALRKQSASGALLENLHDLGRTPKFRLTDEQMNMFRHDQISDNHEAIVRAPVRESKGSGRGYVLGSEMVIGDNRNR